MLRRAAWYSTTRNPKRAYVARVPRGLSQIETIIYFGPKADPARAIEIMGHADNLGIAVRVLFSAKPYR